MFLEAYSIKDGNYSTYYINSDYIVKISNDEECDVTVYLENGEEYL